MTTDALHKDASRGAQAEALLRNELLNELYESFERECTVASFALATTRDKDDDRRNFSIAVALNKRHRACLQNIASNGKLAQRELDEIARMGERKK